MGKLKGFCYSEKEILFIKDKIKDFSIFRKIRHNITKYFGDVTLRLSVYQFKDFPFEEELVIYIGTSMDVKEALDKLDTFLEEYWIDHNEFENVSIDLEFIPKSYGKTRNTVRETPAL